jgi:ferric enterobactin receptor
MQHKLNASTFFSARSPLCLHSMQMLKFIVVVILYFLPQILFAQNNGRISGVVVDVNTKKPIEYASVSIASQGKVVNGVVTDKKGAFVLKGLREGTYSLSVAFVGYDMTHKDSLRISAESGDINVNTILLTPSGAALQSVTVTSNTPLVQNKIDRIVYNAANDITSQGGAAIDILKKVPQVTVDIDGNVELQGNPNVRFLINGKPSAVFGNSLADALSAIPASQIKSIEAITSPGARYSAQGTGGIINIILKDNKVKGINGIVNLSAGTRLENGSVNLNYKNDNFGMGFFASGNQQLVSKTPIQQIRSSFGNHSSANLVQDGHIDFERHGVQAGANFEWNLSKTSTFSGSFRRFNFGNKNTSVISQLQSSYDSITGTAISTDAIRNAESKLTSHTTDWGLAYRKTFKKEGEELSIAWDASAERPQSGYFQQQVYKGQINPYSGRRSDNPGKQNESYLAIDYSLPLKNDALLETGLEGEFANIYSNANVAVFNPNSSLYVHDAAQSYELGYKRQVYSAYISTTFSIFNKFLDVKAGLRFEKTFTQIDYPNTNIPGNDMLVPSLMLSHKINEQQSIKIAYTKRIERPDYGDVNPFINLSDPYNVSTGNPLLKPELGNNIELGYNRSFTGGGNIYIALFERVNTQDLKQVTTFYPSLKLGDSVYSNVSYSQRQNYGTEYNTGINISASAPITKKLNLRTNVSYTYRQNFLPTGGGGLGGGRGRVNLNATYQFPHDLIAEAFANYNSRFNNIQGSSPQSLIYTFAFRKQLWKKKGSIGFTATNPFTQYVKQQTTTVTSNAFSTYTRWVPYRSFGVTFNLKFGKLEFKKQKEDEGYQKDLPQ